jgi:hypothetical protein
MTILFTIIFNHSLLIDIKYNLIKSVVTCFIAGNMIYILLKIDIDLTSFAKTFFNNSSKPKNNKDIYL